MGSQAFFLVTGVCYLVGHSHVTIYLCHLSTFPSILNMISDHMNSLNLSRWCRFVVFSVTLLFPVASPILAQQTEEVVSSAVTLGEDGLTFNRIFEEPFVSGVRPQISAVSADGRTLYFSWNDSSYDKRGTYAVELAAGANASDIRKVEKELPRGAVYSPDLKRVLYVSDGDLYIADARRDADGQYMNASTIVEAVERVNSPAWATDNQQIAWQQGGEIWVMHLQKGSLRQLYTPKDGQPGVSLNGWIGNHTLLLSSADRSSNRTIYFPEYVGEFVTPGASSRGIPTTTFSTLSVDSAKINELFTGSGWTSSDVSPSGRYVALDVVDAPMKRRHIQVYDLEQDTMVVVFEDSTEGWIYGRTMSFAPGTDELMFQSEQTGWNHIYTVYPDGSGLEQHTTGEYDIPYAEWLDNSSMIMATTEEDLGERHLYKLDLDRNAKQQLTGPRGYRYQFRLSPDRSKIIYAHTTFHLPYDLYMMDLKARRPAEHQITFTVPEAFTTMDWQLEELVRFTGRDGETELSMTILKPEGYDPSEAKQYPAVVFVHGAGSLQNVYNGWSNNYYREYMFHQWLTRKGYVVVEVDYRHSTGYGRKFREDVTNWMGRYETEDIIDGLDWIGQNGDYIDRTRVGIYGGSYGGFMALYATSVAPEHFHAAAALRAVTNWRNYYYANPWYTLPRLGDPEVDEEPYILSSPLDRIEELQHPVLILHGLVDDNVGFQDAVQYIEALIMAGDKEFDMMMYPSEPHGFTKPESWIDEYKRIETFFDRYLNPEF